MICKGLQALVDKNQDVVKYHAKAGNGCCSVRAFVLCCAVLCCAVL